MREELEKVGWGIQRLANVRFKRTSRTKTCSARHVRGRGSTRRPKAQLPPRRTGLAGGLQSWSVLVLSWVGPNAQLKAKQVTTCTRQVRRKPGSVEETGLLIRLG